MLLKCLISFSIMINFSMSNNFVETCGCKKFTYNPYQERVKYLAKLPNLKKLNDLALIGTHSSFSYTVNEKGLQTQELDVGQQLKYGVRVLDIGFGRESNLFKIYADDVSTGFGFLSALVEIDLFLEENPGEFIIMFIRQVYDLSGYKTKGNCKVIDHYITNTMVGHRLVKNWQLNDTIGMYRGKILLASYDDSFEECSFSIYKHCFSHSDLRLDPDIVNVLGVIEKMNYISEFIKYKLYGLSQCYIIDMSFAYERNKDRRVLAKDGGYLDANDQCARPLNEWIVHLFKNPHRSLIIVTADFPTQELIDKINDSNFPDSSWRLE
ncbi:uncharacterized protein LOC128667582 [Microplitis demolitor]|uniref:uncharacterized protein LOC128667582 n=1 Tax=Microplitis demolitor TaxID=69319 RepID=UPI00235B5FD7|nr:uncharacterized protein LOC128667582 [Microplitis demolitor]